MTKKIDYDLAAFLYAFGHSIPDIAARLSVSRWTMRLGLIRKGCKPLFSRPHLRRGTTAYKPAQSLVLNAVRKGLLVRQPCQNCGASGERKDGRSLVDAHHDDYNKPLDIRWLCRKCHYEWHKTNKAIEKVVPTT